MSCCGTNTLVVSGALWEDRSYPCPQHQDSFLFRSNVSAAICTDDLPGYNYVNSPHYEIVLPQNMPSVCIQLTEQRQNTDQDGARFVSAERQSVLAEKESSSISEVGDEDVSLHRTLAKPEEESEENSQRALSGSVHGS